jgi:hypothetical protein
VPRHRLHTPGAGPVQFDLIFSFLDRISVQYYIDGGVVLLCCYTYAMLCFQNDDIGDVYQDEENMAALLVNRDAKNGGLLVVSILLNSFTSSFLKEKQFPFNSTWYIL